MKFKQEAYTVKDLVTAYKSGGLVRNPEYQRGAAWSTPQKQALVDSVFREYPLPPLFLEKKEHAVLGGRTSELYEIIDGQQRILALVEFFNDNYALLAPKDAKLRLPFSLRSASALWAERRFSGLPDALRFHLENHEVLVYVVEGVNNPDEVRDLFIRLQSGTALTRQQIRDAWPGTLGPRIESWAGKLKRQPKYQFFTAVDGRGTRDDEDDTNDPYLKHRTTCAQLCALLLRRSSDPFNAPSTKATDLDALYHEYTQTPSSSDVFASIESVFDDLEDVVNRIAVKRSGRRKIAKITLFALALFLQDVKRSPHFRLVTDAKQVLAKEASEPSVQQNSRASSGGVIKDYYERWRESLPLNIGIKLDPKRTFDPALQDEIRIGQNGKCAICGDNVQLADEEYDHHPVPWRDGGTTTLPNGRLVHKECHPRGRPRDL